MTSRESPHVLIIGAGSTGAALAHDLALRGARVTVVERGEIASGTTGRNHCLLHSGARYCLTDPVSARECIEENALLRKILPQGMECNGGLFIALNEEDYSMRAAFLEACETCGIPAREIPMTEALRLEPGLNPKALSAVLVPDGVFEPYRFCLAFLATAQRNGARVRTFCRAAAVLQTAGIVSGVVFIDTQTGSEEYIAADAVINAAGPWAGEVAALAGVDVPVAPTAGVMVTIIKRWNQRVINRLSEPSDGDIIVPVRQTSIIGTTSWAVTDPDRLTIPPDDVRRMLECGDRMLPGIGSGEIRGIMAASRPLVAQPEEDARRVSRDFVCLDHDREGANGFFTLIGGKTTTARLMAERAADLVCQRLNWEAVCSTRSTVLDNWRLFRGQ